MINSKKRICGKQEEGEEEKLQKMLASLMEI
jgi:hypothetical protein